LARHGARAGYEIAGARVYVGDAHLPDPLSRAATRLMERAGIGMQLQVWLRAAGGRAAPAG
jgi:hypothetical protein